MPKLPIAIVVWDDAHGSATKDVTEKQLPHEPVKMTTMGWLLREDATGVSLANELFVEEGVNWYRGHTFIPKAMVRSVQKFALTKTRKRKNEGILPQSTNGTEPTS